MASGVSKWTLYLQGQEMRPEVVPSDKVDPAHRVVGWASRPLDVGRRVMAWATIALDSDQRPIVRSLGMYVDAYEPIERRLPGDPYERPRQLTASDGLSSADLRSFAVNQLLVEVAERLADVHSDARFRFMEQTPDEVTDLLTEKPQRRRRRTANAVPDAKLRRVAELYLEEQHKGRGLRRRIAKRLRMPESAEPTIRYWITRAREEGWLTKAEHGAARAGEGPKLRAYREAKEKKGN